MVMTKKGVTALYIASQEGHVTVVKPLLEKGADVKICEKVPYPYSRKLLRVKTFANFAVLPPSTKVLSTNFCVWRLGERHRKNKA